MTAFYADLEALGSDGFNHHQLLYWQRELQGPREPPGPVSTHERLLRVLVIDDDHDTADCLGQLVELWGHEVQVAYRGLQGLEMAAQSCPDVVLLDIEMPDMDGFTFASNLRARAAASECFLIAVTGRMDDRRRGQCDASGIDLVLIKPVDGEILETLLIMESLRMNGSAIPDTLGS